MAALQLLCGKAGAGKSTLAAELAQREGRLLISEDRWLSALYQDEQKTLADYVRNAARLKTAVGPHIVELLRQGMSVTLDFPGNTPAVRGWAKSLAEQARVEAELHWLDAADSLCLQRINFRNQQGEHPYTLSEAEFAQIASFFIAPDESEGLKIFRYQAA
ncbi:AAA family ATPase [Dryocola sp. BD613]|uniref:AAA family ATPase n=1 Tax=Dryocola sp. BD613 TaxID=3133272 RepID=UPI003F4FFCA8